MHHVLTALSLSLLVISALTAADDIGTTRIARWKDDKAAAFVLMFDDSIPTDLKNVIPELKKHGFTGTFYINPGSGHFAAARSTWEIDVPAGGFELANHTMTHKGVKSLEDAEREIGGCNDAIHHITATLPWPRLVSWGQPGVKAEDWTLSKEDLAAQLTKNHLVLRPDFGGRGAMIAFKTAPEMLAHVDRAIAAGTMESIVFHGVGGDWIVTPLPVFTGLLDGLDQRTDKLWITNHIPAHQYATERDAATVTVGEKSAAKIRLTVACAVDSQFYHQPLTLVTSVPTNWTACVVEQGNRRMEVISASGVVRYEAVPGGDVVMITPKQ